MIMISTLELKLKKRTLRLGFLEQVCSSRLSPYQFKNCGEQNTLAPLLLHFPHLVAYTTAELATWLCICQMHIPLLEVHGYDNN